MTHAPKTSADYTGELLEQEAKHDALLTELEIPTYTGRHLQAQWVASKEGSAITGTTGWTAGAPDEVLQLLDVGDPYILETRNFSQITGWIIGGRWYDRKSDQDLQRQLDACIEDTRRRNAEHVAANRDAWTRREAALPEWIAERMRAIRANNPDFETESMGWGYELIVCELAVLYAGIGVDILDKTSSTITDTPAITAFADANGTSGTQHEFALALAKQHLRAE